MLIEFWESLRGYDRWVETQATVTSATPEQNAHRDRSGRVYYTSGSGDVIIWTDANGRERRGFFSVPDGSRLYDLLGGETITIRYNPARPDQFYLRELLRTRVNTAVRRVLLPLTLLAVVGVGEWLRARHLLPAMSGLLKHPQ